MESPGGWVRTVAVNQLRRSLRRRALEERLLQRSFVFSPGAASSVDAPDLDLWDAVAALPLRQREVIALRYVDDRTEAEVANVLGISEGAVSASLVKARTRLASVLGEPTPAPVSLEVQP
jgi:RNA polymerase sigma factor (sigma-70 family)